MCKNIFWQCIFCDTALHHSITIPQLCHYARVSGYECIPLEQEQWPIPSYALCTSCREKMQSRRRRGGRGNHHRTRTGSLPLFVEGPLPAMRHAEEQLEDEDAAMHDDEGHYGKEGYIWEWIPTPTAASFATPSVSGSSCDDWHFPGNEMYEDSDGDGWRSRSSTAPSTTTNNTGEQERIEESESACASCSNSPLESSHRPSNHRYRSFIPVPVKERPLRHFIGTSSRLRSNIPVASSRIAGGKQQRQSPAAMSSVFDGSECELESDTELHDGDGDGVAGPDEVDWEYFDQITF